MRRKELDELLQRYKSGEVSKSEKLLIDEWYREFDGEQGFIDSLTQEEKEEVVNSLFLKIQKEIDSSASGIAGLLERQLPGRLNRNSFRTRYSFSSQAGLAAAFTALLVVSSIFYFLLKGQEVTHSTAYGQILHLVLPDSSRVVLNGNTSISYASHWEEGQEREVFLEGEAFFSVKSGNSRQKFIVYSGN